MKLNDKKIIYTLLVIILVFSSILIYKIEKTPKYNKDVYEQVYKEFEQISSINIDNNIESTSKKNNTIYVSKNSTGNTYITLGVIDIPKINVSYPIINDCTEENLNIAPTKLVGPEPNTIGNLVIVGHNNWNKEFFSNLYKLENDDIIELTDTSGNKLTYKVYDKYEIKQDDFSCLNQNTNGQIELTLLTCVKFNNSKRLIIKCVAI